MSRYPTSVTSKSVLFSVMLATSVTSLARADILGSLTGGDVVQEGIDLGLSALLERTKVVNPRREAPLGVTPLGRGVTIELREAYGSRQNEQQIERAIAEVLKLDPKFALIFLNDRQARLLEIQYLLNEQLARAGMQVVLNSDDLSRWSQQRRSERSNPEVRQNSLPPEQTIERPMLVATWNWQPLAGLEFNRWLQLVVQRGVAELTSQLSVEMRVATTGVLIGSFTVPVEMRVVGSGQSRRGGLFSPSSRQPQYAKPFLHAMESRAAQYLGQMLVAEEQLMERVIAGQLRLSTGLPTPAGLDTTSPGAVEVEPGAANGGATEPSVVAATQLTKLEPAEGLPRHRVFGVFVEGLTVVTIGRFDGVVQGSQLRIGSDLYTADQVADFFAFVWAINQSVVRREPLQVDTLVQLVPATESILGATSSTTSALTTNLADVFEQTAVGQVIILPTGLHYDQPPVGWSRIAVRVPSVYQPEQLRPGLVLAGYQIIGDRVLDRLKLLVIGKGVRQTGSAQTELVLCWAPYREQIIGAEGWRFTTQPSVEGLLPATVVPSAPPAARPEASVDQVIVSQADLRSLADQLAQAKIGSRLPLPAVIRADRVDQPPTGWSWLRVALGPASNLQEWQPGTVLPATRTDHDGHITGRCKVLVVKLELVDKNDQYQIGYRALAHCWAPVPEGQISAGWTVGLPAN